MIRLPLALLVVLLSAAPALAYPNCLASGGYLEFRFSVGEEWTEDDENEYLLDLVHDHGIYADTAERSWLDCIKITRLERGGWVTEYLDPYTFEVVE
jgi:hypothetical protein